MSSVSLQIEGFNATFIPSLFLNNAFSEGRVLMIASPFEKSATFP
jgi:hypothetical protein